MGYSLLGLFGDGFARSYSIPGLKEIGSVKVSGILDVRRFHEAIITNTGDILGWKGPSEMALINVFGTGQNLCVAPIRHAPNFADWIQHSIQGCSVQPGSHNPCETYNLEPSMDLWHPIHHTRGHGPTKYVTHLI
jgi:hypothetical protein